MDRPLIEERTREDFVRIMKERAEEKGFSMEGQGLAPALVTLYSYMVSDTVKRLNMVPERHRNCFYNLQNQKRKFAGEADTVLVFQGAEGYQKAIPVRRGTAVTGKQGDRSIRFLSEWDFDVIPGHITGGFVASRESDQVCRIPMEAGRPGGFCLEDFSAYPVERRQLLFLFTGLSPDSKGEWNIHLSLDLEGQACMAALADPGRFCWEICLWPEWTEEGIPVELHKGRIELPAEVTAEKAGEFCLAASGPAFDARAVRFVGIQIRQLDQGCPDLVIRRVQACTEGQDIRPDLVCSGDEGLPDQEFYPFKNPMESCVECLVFSNDALGRRDTEVTMEFDWDLEELVRKAPKIPDQTVYKWIMKKPEPKEEPEPETAAVRELKLEYWNGTVYYPVEYKSGSLDDTTQAGHVVLVFNRPDDMVPADEEDGRYYLRLSCGVCEALYHLPVAIHTPKIRNLKFAYRYPSPKEPEKILAWNFSEQEEAALDTRAFRPFSWPDSCGGDAILLKFDRLVPQGRMQMYFEIEPYGMPAAPVVVYGGEGSMMERLISNDGTEGLSHSGILSVMLPEKVSEASVCGEEGFFIRIEHQRPKGERRSIRRIYGNAQQFYNREEFRVEAAPAELSEQGEMTLPHGGLCGLEIHVKREEEDGWKLCRRSGDGGSLDMYEYTAEPDTGHLRFSGRLLSSFPADRKKCFRIDYQICDGAAANLPAGSITGQEKPIPFIESVENPYPVLSGKDWESDRELERRCMDYLYHGGRAVTPGDVERMVMAEFGAVLYKVRCIRGNPMRLGIIYRDSSLQEVFQHLGDQIKEYLYENSCIRKGGTEIAIQTAVPVDITLDAVILADRQISIQAIRDLKERLTGFLDPFTGGFEGLGWEMGELPDEEMIRAFLKVHDPQHILTEVRISAGAEGKEGRLEDMKEPFYIPGKVVIRQAVKLC